MNNVYWGYFFSIGDAPAIITVTDTGYECSLRDALSGKCNYIRIIRQKKRTPVSLRDPFTVVDSHGKVVFRVRSKRLIAKITESLLKS